MAEAEDCYSSSTLLSRRRITSRILTISQRLQSVHARIAEAAVRAGRAPDSITLVAVTKTTTPAAIREALEAGVIHFGENRVQDAQRKLAELPSIKSRSTWHMVGHIQTNKVKTVLALFDIIQSVDSLRVAEAISKQSQGRVPVLLEVNVAVEATKFGFSPEELPDAVARIRDLPNVEVRGLMTVAPLVEQQEQVRPVFRRLRELGDRLGLSELSMGMTNDFEVAIEEGATIVRIGRAIFGEQAA